MKNFLMYKSCIDACLKCASLCNYCARSCAAEKDVAMMARCIQLDMECASICYAAVQLMSLGSNKANEICKICAEICDACGKECLKHENDHCMACSNACRKCAKECLRMAA
jgi:hypothetical protein